MSELIKVKEKWPVGTLQKKDYRNMSIDELQNEFDLYLNLYKDIASIEIYIEEQNQKLKENEEQAEEIRKHKPEYVYIAAAIGGVVLGIAGWISSGSLLTGIICLVVVALLIWWILGGIHMFFHGAKQARDAQEFLDSANPPVFAEIDMSNDYINYINNDLQLESFLSGIVGPENANPYCVNKIAELLKTARADNLKEALNLFDEIKHREHMAEMAELTAAEALKQTELLKDVEANSHAAANAAKANAAINYGTYRNIKKMNKKR